MKKIFQLTTLVAMALVVFSCTKKEVSTEQFDTTAVVLKAYGPQPVVRGGILRFVGSNLDKVVSVTIPGVAPLTPEVVTAGVHSEIRVTVPKDGPELGYPVLTLADGSTITAKTQLSYSEPILFESFSPTEVLPGTTITIKGDYLNLIHEVILPGDVYIPDDLFVAHDRYTIKVTVPETARTGKIGLGTLDESEVEDDKVLATLNVVESEEDLVVLTAEGALTAKSYKAGDAVTIKGTNLTLTKKVELEGADVTEFAATATTLTFVLPDTATDGEVLMVMASEVAVSAGTLTTVAPVVSGVTPAPVKNGAVVTLAGSDLDLVTGLDFPHAAGAEFTFAEGLIKAAVPEAAQEGDLTLHLANGKTVSANLTLVKPVVTEFSANPAAAGSDITITGTNLDLVAAVTFQGSAAVEVEATETQIVVGVPTAAESGKLVFTLKNGASLEVETELAIDKPAGAYIGVMPEEVLEIGDMFIAEVLNIEHLTDVLIDDVKVNYLVSGNLLYVVIPEGAKAGSQLTLVSDNGSVTYTMNIDPGTQAAFVIWSGNEDLGSWSNQPYVGQFGFLLEHPEFVPGDVLRFSIVPNADWWQLQIFDGNWGGQVCTAPTAESCPDGVFDLVLDQALIDKLNGLENWGGLFVVQGENCSLIQITAIHYIPQETAIWEGSEDLGSWSNQPYVGEFGALTTYNIAEGDRIRFYITPNADWWQMQIYDGNWGGQICTAPTAENCPNGVYDVVLDQATIDKLNGLENWGGLFVVQGENCTLTKISLVYLVKD